MTQGKRETVTIAVALTEDELKGIRDKTFASARDKFGQTGADTVETELISVSSSMSARLTGSPNLQIKELSTQEQLITSENPTIWHWEVLPPDSGEAELYLVLSNIRRLSRSQGPRTHKEIDTRHNQSSLFGAEVLHK